MHKFGVLLAQDDGGLLGSILFLLYLNIKKTRRSS